MQIQVEIKRFINNHENGMKKLVDQTGIGDAVFKNLLSDDNKNRKYFKQTLDILYDFFDIPRDHFYKMNLKKWYPKTLSILWSLLREKRCALGLDIEEVARATQIDRRALARLEAGDSMPNAQSYTILKLCKMLNFNKEEMQKINAYINAYKDIEKISKKYIVE